MKTQKLITLLSFVMIGLFVVAIAFFRFAGKKSDQTHLISGERPSTLVSPPETVTGSFDVCRYWTPWLQAFAPHQPSAIMRLVFDRARQRATRTTVFKQWATSRPKPTEDVCATGQRQGDLGDFVMDLAPDTQTCSPGLEPLDFAIRMNVEPGKKYRRNHFDLKVRTDSFSAERLRGLISDQTVLLKSGYVGWKDAFPEFSNAQNSAILISHAIDKLPDSEDSSSIKTTIHWDPQRFWRRLPLLATWVLNLGGMISFDTTVMNGKGEVIAHAITDTRTPGSQIEIPLSLRERFDLTPDNAFALNVAHSVTVNYRGLVITAKNLRYDGHLTSTGNAISYSGRFTGIEAVEISGAYKGLTALGVDDMLHKMIREAIESEVDILTNGNDGKGWLIKASIAPDPERPSSSIFSLAMELEAQVHMTQLVRYESDAKAGTVLPGKDENQEFGSYIDDVLAALLRDSQRFQCD